MKKVVLTIICVAVFLGTVFTTVAILRTGDNKMSQEKVEKVSEEEILDECTDEYEQMQHSDMVATNVQEEKTSPNCSFTIKTYYPKCGHITSQYQNLPQELVNLTRSEIQEKYQDYQIEKFASNEIILYQEHEGECGEHYLVKDKEGTITIYKVLEDGTEKEEEVTGITTEYLPETDIISMKNGLRVNGRQELNRLIEDFE